MKLFSYYSTIFLILFGFSHLASSQQLRDFSNTSGKVIKAAIVSATDTDVTLQMENGRTITGGISFFSKKDQAYIRTWLKENPPKLEYEFDIVATKSREDRKRSTEGNTIVTYETWLYKLKIENRTKPVQELSGLNLEYNIVMSPKARATNVSSRSEKGLASSGRYRIKKGKMSLPAIKYLERKEFGTSTFPLNKSELAPGWYYADGTKDERDDDLEGIWIKITHGGEVVLDKKIGSQSMDNISWSAP